MPEPITRDEWFAELERLGQVAANGEQDGFLTAREIREGMGWSARRLNRALDEAKAADRLEVRDIRKTNRAGRISTVPAYRVKPEKGEPK